MIQLICVLLSLLISNFARAQYADSNASASRVCANLVYADDKIKCMSIIQNKQFDDNAIRVCASMVYSDDKLTCLQQIANKRFTSQAEVNICSSLVYSNDKLRCLSKASFVPYGYGSGVPGDIPLYSLEVLVNEALLSMRNYDYRRAESILVGLQAQLRAYQNTSRR